MKKFIFSLLVVVGVANAFPVGVYKCDLERENIIAVYTLKQNGLAMAEYYLRTNGTKLNATETGYWNDAGDSAIVLRRNIVIEQQGRKFNMFGSSDVCEKVK